MLKMSAHLHQDIRESSIPPCSLDATESMVCYHILPTDRLECRVSVYVGQLQITVLNLTIMFARNLHVN